MTAPLDLAALEAVARAAILEPDQLRESNGDDGETCHRCHNPMSHEADLDLSPFCNPCGHVVAYELGHGCLALLAAARAGEELRAKVVAWVAAIDADAAATAETVRVNREAPHSIRAVEYERARTVSAETRSASKAAEAALRLAVKS